MLLDLALIAVLAAAVVIHLRRSLRREVAAGQAAERGGLNSAGPQAQHPHIDISHCIGCGACVEACPEGDVLAVLNGKAAIVQGHKCIGHGLCADVCPVGAIEIVMAPPSVGADLPALTPEFESSVEQLFIVGELGGLALIKNAVNEGRDCIDIIAERLPALRRPRMGEVVDICIVGAGPAGLSASLRAIERKLSFLTLEAEEFGGTVAKYPRQKLVMTSPVEFPMHGKWKKLEVSKEELLAFWAKVARQAGLRIHTGERVEHVQKDDDGAFTVTTTKRTYRALTVVMAIGRRGTPRKLDVPGEDLPKVMYSLIEAGHYVDQRILVVGGGDSAVEAAMGLALQKGNKVTLSYRKDTFSRLKDRNDTRIRDFMRKRQLEVIFNSQPEEIHPDHVVLRVEGGQRKLPNDYVWVFAGGTPPNAFLEKIGVQVGMADLTDATGDEPRQVA